MATSPAGFKATAQGLRPDGMLKFPVLPPIEGSQQQRGEVGQATAAKEEIAKKIKVQKKLLRHRRSKVQQQQLQMLLYVFSQELFVSTSMIATGGFLQCDSLLTEFFTGCPEQWRLMDRAKRGGQCAASHQSHSFHLLYDNHHGHINT